MAEWQPIETAPETGVFLVWMEKPELGVFHVMPIHRHPNITIIGHHFYFDCMSKPTHWMPLPDPPADRRQRMSELPIVERLRSDCTNAHDAFDCLELMSTAREAADLITELVAALEKARGTIVMMREEIPVGGFAGHQTEVDIDAALARARSKG